MSNWWSIQLYRCDLLSTSIHWMENIKCLYRTISTRGYGNHYHGEQRGKRDYERQPSINNHLTDSKLIQCEIKLLPYSTSVLGYTAKPVGLY